MTAPYPIGVLGGGRTGHCLAVELSRQGTRVLAFDEREKRLAAFLEETRPGDDLAVASSLRDLVEHLEPPRRILLSLAEDEPATELLDALTAMIEHSDVVADLSHSYFRKTERREALMARPGARYLDVGACPAPADPGHCRFVFHVGGHRVAYEVLRSTLEQLAPSVDGPAVAYLGPAGAGHVVANVAECLELAFRQAAAEMALVVWRGGGLTTSAAAQLLRDQNRNRCPFQDMVAFHLEQPGASEASLCNAQVDRSRLAEVLRRTVRTALDFSVPVPTLSAGVETCLLLRRQPDKPGGTLPPPLPAPPLAGWSEDDPAVALTAVAAIILLQGLNLIQAVAEQLDYGTRLSDIARVWRGIAGFDRDTLDAVSAGLAIEPQGALVRTEPVLSFLEARLPALRRVAARCALAGIPVSVHSSALAYLDHVTRACLD